MKKVCVRCKEEKDTEEMNRHSVVGVSQRYICRPCNAARMAMRRSIHKTSKKYPQSANLVSTQVSTEKIEPEITLVLEDELTDYA